MSTEEYSYKEIDGTKYVCEMMPALKANAVFFKLAGLVGRPALMLAAGVFNSLDSKGEISGEEVADLAIVGVENIFSGRAPEEANEILLSMMDGVRAEKVGSLDNDSTFNQHFRGKLLTAYKVWTWALQCNYRDFFDAAQSSDFLATMAAKGEAALKSATQTQES